MVRIVFSQTTVYGDSFSDSNRRDGRILRGNWRFLGKRKARGQEVWGYFLSSRRLGTLPTDKGFMTLKH
jgi:hypothetical protein